MTKRFCRIVGALALIAVAAGCILGVAACSNYEGEIKKVSVDGVECTAETIESGEYALQRPFNLVYVDETLSGAARTFMEWTLSDAAVAITKEEGYVVTREGYEVGTGVYEGRVALSGSTSVYPLMMVLAEEYMKLYPSVSVTVQGGGSGVGLSDAVAGICDIGMISKDLDEEAYPTLSYVTLCTDGIAVIVNENCPVDAVTSEELYGLYAEGTPIQGVIVAGIGRDSSSGTRSAFDELIGIETDYVRGIEQLSDTGFVISLIQENKKGDTIAYVSAGSV